MQFRTKPVIVEATQWFKHGDHPAVSLPPSDEPIVAMALKDHPEWGYLLRHKSIGLIVVPGDWIIEDEEEGYFRMRDNDFKEKFEAL
jgi:hypothetical protein